MSAQWYLIIEHALDVTSGELPAGKLCSLHPSECRATGCEVLDLRQGRIGECKCSHYDAYWHMGMGADNASFIAHMQDEFDRYRQMVSVHTPKPA